MRLSLLLEVFISPDRFFAGCSSRPSMFDAARYLLFLKEAIGKIEQQLGNTEKTLPTFSHKTGTCWKIRNDWFIPIILFFFRLLCFSYL